MPYPDPDWVKQSIDKSFYRTRMPRKRLTPFQRMRRKKAIEKRQLELELQKAKETGLHCPHGIYPDECIKCHPELKPSQTVDLDMIPF
jgi:hypothetical protein